MRADRPHTATGDGTDALDRRHFLHVGGVTIALAAVLAACGTDDDATPAATTTTAPPSPADVGALRTGSSLERLAVEVYTRAIESGLLTANPAALEAAELFQAHHEAHAAMFDGATTRAGGEIYAQPNPAVLGQLQPALTAVGDQATLLRFLHDLEAMLAATYQALAGRTNDVRVNVEAMSVCGVEARHAAVLAGLVGSPQMTSGGFGETNRAVAPGTGV